jgi:hypothetical protein
VTDHCYSAFLFPRIYATLIGIILAFFSVSKDGTNIALCLLGCGLFLASNFYAVYRFFRGDRIN